MEKRIFWIEILFRHHMFAFIIKYAGGFNKSNSCFNEIWFKIRINLIIIMISRFLSRLCLILWGLDSITRWLCFRLQFGRESRWQRVVCLIKTVLALFWCLRFPIWLKIVANSFWQTVRLFKFICILDLIILKVRIYMLLVSHS